MFREHARFVAGFLYRLGVGRNEIDDLVQDVFIVVHRKGGFVPDRARPRTWLGAIALRVVSDTRRSAARRPEIPIAEASGLEDQRPLDPNARLEAREALLRVQRALGTLDIQHRAVFVLFEIEGESAQAIADALEIPVGTVYSRLHHARKTFLEAYAALGSPASTTRAPVPIAEGA